MTGYVCISLAVIFSIGVGIVTGLIIAGLEQARRNRERASRVVLGMARREGP